MDSNNKLIVSLDSVMNAAKEIQFSGGNDEMDTPVPIPNTAVKHLSADNTWLETARESKSLPDLYQSFKRKRLKLCFML